jgi:H+/Cl- antiporter ClcA
MSIVGSIKDNLSSASPLHRGVTATALAIPTSAVLSGLAVGGWRLFDSNSKTAVVPAVIRATLTSTAAFGGIAALSNVHLTGDRFKDTFAGAGLGTAVGLAGTAAIDMVWNSRNLTPKELAGHSLVGAAIGGGIYATLGLTGLTEKKL